MSEEFEKAYKLYRKRIEREGGRRLLSELSSGKVKSREAIRAAHAALEEWSNKSIIFDYSIPVQFSHLFSETMINKYCSHIRQHWQWWIMAVIAFFAMIGTFASTPDVETIARNVNAKQVAENIDIQQLAKIIQQSTELLSSTDLKKIVPPQELDIPERPKGFMIPRKPTLNAEQDNSEPKEVTRTVAACIMLAAKTYEVPPAVLFGIYMVEGGRVGGEVGPFSDGAYLLGPMKISSNWIPNLAKKWDVRDRKAYDWVKNDPCTNMGVSSWMLRDHMNHSGSLSKAIALYGAGPLNEGEAYLSEVVSAMKLKGLIRDSSTR